MNHHPKFFRSSLFSIVFMLASWQLAISQQTYTQEEADKLFAKAIELREQGNYGAARQSFELFLKTTTSTDTKRADATFGLASVALKSGNKDGEALTHQFVTSYATHPQVNTLRLELAQYFYQDQKFSKAITAFSKVEFDKLTAEQQMHGKFQFGYSYFTERKLTEALGYFNQVKFNEHAYTAAANYYAGFIEYSEAKYDEALADLKKAETNEGYKNIVPYLIASVYYRKSQFDELLKYSEKVSGNTAIKNRKELLLLVAEAHYAKGDYSKAAFIYSESLQDKTIGDAGVWYRAGLSNIKAGNSEEAIRLFELSANTKDPIAFVASYQLGFAYLQQGQKLYAINAFDQARKTDDKNIAEAAQFTFAKVLYDQGQADRAIVEFEFYLKTYPQGEFDNETKELLAQAYINGNNYNKAIEYIEAIQQKSPVIEQAYQKAAYLKGVELFNKDLLTEAIVYFAKSLSYPRDEKFVQRASFWNAEAYAIQKKYSESINFYQQSIKAGSSDLSLQLQAYYGLGHAYYNQKLFDRALPNFSEFVSKGNKQSSNYADGLLRLADCYYIEKRFDDALLYYNRYKQMGGADMDYALLQAGLIFGMQRKYDESRIQLRSLVENYPASSYRAEALYQRAQFDLEQGSYASAIEALTQLLTSEPTSAYKPYAYARRAASYFNTKDYSKTIDDYTTLIKQYPSHPLSQEVLLPLQEALDIAGRSSEFDQYLASVKKANPDNKGLENLEYETAKKLHFNEQYDKAVIALQSFISTYPQSTFITEANYYVAESYYRLRKWEQALPVYISLKAFPTFNYAARVAARSADVSFKLGRYQEAIDNFHYYERYATTKKDQYTVYSGLMESFFLLAQYDSSDHYARQILEKTAINTSAENKASLFIGKAAMAKGDYNAAQDEFLNTLNTARDEYGAEAKYQLATIFFLRKDYKQCYETLISLNKDFASYDLWVGKSYLLLSDNFLAQQDVFQAKATLQSLVDNFPLEFIKTEARSKLKSIELQEAALIKQDSLQTDDNK